MQALLLPAWFVISGLFAYLAYWHYRESETPLRKFAIRERDDGDVSESDKDVGRGVIEDFNRYLETINLKNQTKNRRAAIWYFMAAFVAILSLFIAGPLS
jgi:hypothetical protein